MVNLDELPRLTSAHCRAYRLVNSKYPPINLFDDVASEAEFEALHELQALTNPRLLCEAGDLGLVSQVEIPFGITGCSYAVAPFTHVNPDGSRFSDGTFGVLYLADTMETALAEVRHHQAEYWSNVPALHFDRFVFRGLACEFSEAGLVDACKKPLSDPIFSPDDYTAGRIFGCAIKEHGLPGLRYHSVRRAGAVCWGLMSPGPVHSIIQSAHMEMIWSDGILSVNQLSQP